MIKNIEKLASQGDVEVRKVLLSLADLLLNEIEASTIIRRNLKIVGEDLILKGKKIRLYFDRIFVIGFGKASVPMAMEIERILGDRIYAGMLNSPYPGNLKRMKVNLASHPYPDEKTLEASQKIIELLKDARENDLVIVLISGGASSLFEIPRDGMSIDEERKIIRKMMLEGADVIKLNKMRIRLSKVKGGGLVNYIKPARCLSLIISDVMGPPKFVGSGPTYLDTREKYCENIVLADNRYALEKAKEIAEGMGIDAIISPTILEGEPRDMAPKMVEEIKNVHKRLVIWGGETTVKVEGGGIGGRNQELALYLAREMRGRMGFITLGTDGIDGPTDAAGGIVDETTIPRIRERGIDLERELQRHNSNSVLRELGDLIITGYTGTNLADICIGYRP